MGNAYGLTDLSLYNSMGYNPYFMNAFNSPNANMLSFYGYNNAGQAQGTQQNSEVQSNTTDATTTTMAAKDDAKKEESNSGAALAVIGTVATIGAACLCRKAYKAGTGTKTTEKILNGFKSWFNSAIDEVGSKLAGKAEKFSITKVNGETVCTIPGKTNRIKTGDIATQAQKLGISTEAAQLTDKESKIISYVIRDNGNEIFVRGGRIVGYKNALGESLNIKKLTAPTEAGDIAYSKTIKEIMSKVGKKDATALSQIEDVFFTQTSNGATRKFVANATDASKDGLRGIETNKFTSDSKVVKQYLANNKNVDDAFKEFGEGKFDKLKAVEAQYEIPGLGRFKIENDKVVGVTIGGKYHKAGSTDFDALYYDNKEAFENILKNKDSFTNVVYNVT